jgi:hypothetical protein
MSERPLAPFVPVRMSTVFECTSCARMMPRFFATDSAT